MSEPRRKNAKTRKLMGALDSFLEAEGVQIDELLEAIADDFDRQSKAELGVVVGLLSDAADSLRSAAMDWYVSTK